MKSSMLLAAVFFSFNAFSATLDLDCIGGSVAVNGEDISVEQIYLQEKISLVGENSVVILVSKDGMKIISENDLTAEDNGKTLLVLGQNIDPEGKDPVGLNLVEAKIDTAEANGVKLLNIIQVGDINNVDLTEVNLTEKFILKCENSK